MNIRGWGLKPIWKLHDDFQNKKLDVKNTDFHDENKKIQIFMMKNLHSEKKSS